MKKLAIITLIVGALYRALTAIQEHLNEWVINNPANKKQDENFKA